MNPPRVTSSAIDRARRLLGNSDAAVVAALPRALQLLLDQVD